MLDGEASASAAMKSTLKSVSPLTRLAARNGSIDLKTVCREGSRQMTRAIERRRSTPNSKDRFAF
jgi:hypothetical protein